MNKIWFRVACWGLAFGTAVVVVIATLIGLSSDSDNEAGLVKVTNPLIQKILATNGWSEVRSNQLFKLVRRFDGEPSTLQLFDAHDIQNDLIAAGTWKEVGNKLRFEIVVDEEGVQRRQLVNPSQRLRTDKSPYPVWDITEEQAKWLRGWFPVDLKVEGCLFTGTKQEPRLEAMVAFFSPTQSPMKIPMDVLIPKPYSLDDREDLDGGSLVD